MAEHRTNKSNSNWDKHTNRDSGRKQDKIKGNKDWVDQGSRTNSQRNKDRTIANKK